MKKILTLLISAGISASVFSTISYADVPDIGPLPPVPVNPDNPPTPERIALEKKLSSITASPAVAH